MWLVVERPLSALGRLAISLHLCKHGLRNAPLTIRGSISGTVSLLPRYHPLTMKRLKKELNSHQMVFLVRGWGLGMRLGTVGSFQSGQALSADLSRSAVSIE